MGENPYPEMLVTDFCRGDDDFTFYPGEPGRKISFREIERRAFRKICPATTDYIIGIYRALLGGRSGRSGEDHSGNNKGFPGEYERIHGQLSETDLFVHPAIFELLQKSGDKSNEDQDSGFIPLEGRLADGGGDRPDLGDSDESRSSSNDKRGVASRIPANRSYEADNQRRSKCARNGAYPCDRERTKRKGYSNSSGFRSYSRPISELRERIYRGGATHTLWENESGADIRGVLPEIWPEIYLSYSEALIWSPAMVEGYSNRDYCGDIRPRINGYDPKISWPQYLGYGACDSKHSGDSRNCYRERGNLSSNEKESWPPLAGAKGFDAPNSLWILYFVTRNSFDKYAEIINQYYSSREERDSRHDLPNDLSTRSFHLNDYQHEGEGNRVNFSTFLQEGFFASPSPKIQDNFFIGNSPRESPIRPFITDFDGAPLFLFKYDLYYPERKNFVGVYTPFLESLARPILNILYYIILCLYYREKLYIRFRDCTHQQSSNPSGQNKSILNNNRKEPNT